MKHTFFLSTLCLCLGFMLEAQAQRRENIPLYEVPEQYKAYFLLAMVSDTSSRIAEVKEVRKVSSSRTSMSVLTVSPCTVGSMDKSGVARSASSVRPILHLPAGLLAILFRRR